MTICITFNIGTLVDIAPERITCPGGSGGFARFLELILEIFESDRNLLT